MPPRNFQRRANAPSNASQSRLGTRIKEANALDIQDLEATKQLTDASMSSRQTHNPPTPDREVHEEPLILRPDGHVRVGVRVKPSLGSEPNEFDLEIHRADRTVRVPRSYLNSKKYTFDAVFPESTNAEQVYREMVQPLVQQVVAGYSAAVTAFGPQGSGKTRTIGSGGNSMWEGAIAFSSADLLTEVKEHTDWRLLASFAEVEPEGAVDLLASHARRASDMNNSRVKEAAEKFGNKAGGLGTLTSREVRDVEDCLEIVRQGNFEREHQTSDRKGGANHHGNVIFRLQLVRPAQVGEDKKWLEASETYRYGGRIKALHAEGCVVSSLLLVDLAGSERPKGSKAAARAAEAKGGGWQSRAVASLMDAVSNMGGIRKNQEHLTKTNGRAPLWVRETALTWLLKDALFGRAWWSVIVTVKAGGEDLKEEDSALLFGERVRLGKLRPRWNLASDWNAVDDGPERKVLEQLSPNPFLKASVFHKSLSPRRLMPQASEDSASSRRSSSSKRIAKPTVDHQPRYAGLGYGGRKGSVDARKPNRAWEHPDVEFSKYVKRSLKMQQQEEDEDEDVAALVDAVRAERQAAAFVSDAPWPDMHDTPERPMQSTSLDRAASEDTSNPRPRSTRTSPQATANVSPSRSKRHSSSPAKSDVLSSSRRKDAGVRQVLDDLLDAHGMLLAGEGVGMERALEEAERQEPARSFMQLVQGVVERPGLLNSLIRLRGPGGTLQPAGAGGQASAEKPPARRRLLAPVAEGRAHRVSDAREEKLALAGEAEEAWLLQKLNGIASALTHHDGPAGARATPTKGSPHRGSPHTPHKASPGGSRYSPGGRKHSPGGSRGGLWADLREIEWARRADEVREAGLRSVVQEAEQLAHAGGDSIESLQTALMGRREAEARLRAMRATLVSASAVCEALLHAVDSAAPANPPRRTPVTPQAKPPVTESTGQDLQAKPREAASDEEELLKAGADASTPRPLRLGATGTPVRVRSAGRRRSWPGVHVLTPVKKPPNVPSLNLRKVTERAEQAARKAEQEISEDVPAVDEEEKRKTEALRAEIRELGVARAKDLVRASMGMVAGFYGVCRAELVEKKGKESAVKGAAKRGFFGWMRGKKKAKA